MICLNWTKSTTTNSQIQANKKAKHTNGCVSTPRAQSQAYNMEHTNTHTNINPKNLLDFHFNFRQPYITAIMIKT